MRTTQRPSAGSAVRRRRGRVGGAGVRKKRSVSRRRRRRSMVNTGRTVSNVRMTERMRKNAGTLLALRKAKAAIKRTVISEGKRDLIEALMDCARLIINGEIKPTRAQLQNLRRRSVDITRLLNAQTSVDAKKRVLQKGGFLSALLAPFIATLGKALL
jgi:hypothetical protein